MPKMANSVQHHSAVPAVHASSLERRGGSRTYRSTLVAGLTWFRNLVFTPESRDSATLPVRAISRMPYGCSRPWMAVIFSSLPCNVTMRGIRPAVLNQGHGVCRSAGLHLQLQRHSVKGHIADGTVEDLRQIAQLSPLCCRALYLSCRQRLIRWRQQGKFPASVAYQQPILHI